LRTPNQLSENFRIQVLDLDTWRELSAFDLKGDWRAPAWFADSASFYVIRSLLEPLPPLGNFGGSYPAEVELWRVDVPTGNLELVMTLPYQSVRRVDISTDGRTLFLLAEDAEVGAQGWQPVGELYLSVIDAAARREAGRATIPGLRSSARTDTAYVYFEAGVTLSEATGRYYVAHADSDLVSIVELDTLTVRQTEVSARAKAPLPRRLLGRVESLFVGSAEAKGGDSHQRQAAVTADGRLLLIAGSDFIEGTPPEGGRQKPAGLRVIDTATMRVVLRDPDVTAFTLSGDGRTVYATGYGMSYVEGEGRIAYEGFGLKVIELGSGAIQRFATGAVFEEAVVSRDGRYLVLRGREAPKEPCVVLCEVATVSVFDMQDGAMVRERAASGYWSGFTR
jgi:hypothetical protein